ncbi:MAG: metallophosphoesterase [Pseudomonadales bacterium]|nr:metallophosphoesterase [Pseudomonadales bacterium]
MQRILTITALVLAGVLLAASAVMLILPIKDTRPFEAGHDPGSVSMLLLGDYGTADYRQRRVAAMMEAECRRLGGDLFVQTVGDNFYPDGVTSVDDPLWDDMFESMYDTPCLSQINFYAALGNHDHGGNIDAQMQYGNDSLGSGRWNMPNAYYLHGHGRGTDNKVLVKVVVLDTTAPIDGQLAFLRSAFEGKPDAVWRVVIGHHNIRTRSEKYHEDHRLLNALLPTLKALNVDLYAAGHSHNLQLLEFPGEPIYTVTGGGGAHTRSLLAPSPAEDRFISRALGFATVTFTPTGLSITFTSTSASFFSTLGVAEDTFVADRDCLQAPGGKACLRMILKKPRSNEPN